MIRERGGEVTKRFIEIAIKAPSPPSGEGWGEGDQKVTISTLPLVTISTLYMGLNSLDFFGSVVDDQGWSRHDRFQGYPAVH